VAVSWVLFAADHRDAKSRRSFDETPEPGPEAGVPRKLPVENVSLLVIELTLRWPSTEFLSEKHVIEADVAQRGSELPAIELGVEARERLRPHIRQNLDAFALNQVKE
jgi:hypothetical protein